MERKLVKHGDSTLMVSIPSKWIKRNELSKGDVVEIQDNGPSLAIFRKGARKKLSKAHITIETSNYNEIRYRLGRLQKQEIDEIVVHYKDDEVFSMIHQIIPFLFSYEIIDSDDKSCVIKNVVKEYDFDSKKVINRLVSITKLLFSLVKENFLGDKPTYAEKIKLIRDEGWKFRNIGYITQSNDLIKTSYDTISLINMLEKNLSYLYWIIRAFEKEDISSLSKEAFLLFEKIEEYFDYVINLIRNHEKYEFDTFIITQGTTLLEQCEKLCVKGGKEAAIFPYFSLLINNTGILKSFF